MSETKIYPIIRYDKFGKEIYREEVNGHWEKREYDEKGRQIYWETNRGDWVRHRYDDAGNEIYYENSEGYWHKREYNERGTMTYYEDSHGNVRGKASVDTIVANAQDRIPENSVSNEVVDRELEQ